jgi:transcriptional regulator with XRE-family HTH domain
MNKRRIKTNKEIGERIKKRRRELGITQEKLAETLNVTYQQVQRYENGTNSLNMENIQIIADTLSAPVSYFFELERPLRVAEETAIYQPAEENKLLRYFRKIKDGSSKNTVIQVARLATREKG